MLMMTLILLVTLLFIAISSQSRVNCLMMILMMFALVVICAQSRVKLLMILMIPMLTVI